MSCHCGENTELIQPSVARGILPCIARSAATIVSVCGNSEVGLGQFFGVEGPHNPVRLGPGNGFCFAPNRSMIVFAMPALMTGCSTRIPCGTRPGHEITNGTCTRSEYSAAP